MVETKTQSTNDRSNPGKRVPGTARDINMLEMDKDSIPSLNEQNNRFIIAPSSSLTTESREGKLLNEEEKASSNNTVGHMEHSIEEKKKPGHLGHSNVIDEKSTIIVNDSQFLSTKSGSINNLGHHSRPSLSRRGSAELLLEAAAIAEEMSSSNEVISNEKAEHRNESNLDKDFRETNRHDQAKSVCIVTPPSAPLLQPTHLLSSTPKSALETDNQEDCKLDYIFPKDNKKVNGPRTYNDYSTLPDTIGFVRKKTGGVTQPFPEKLYQMLEVETSSSYSSSSNIQDPPVLWLPHGRAFVVRNPKLFTSNIMPRYFRQTKLTSFQRQLNLYGFRRITQGPDAGAYYHELFLKGRPQLCMRMVRQKVKGTGYKQPTDVASEPNFYKMPPITIFNPTKDPITIKREQQDVSGKPCNIVDQRTKEASFDSNVAMSPGFAAAKLLKGMATATSISLPPSSEPTRSTVNYFTSISKRDNSGNGSS